MSKTTIPQCVILNQDDYTFYCPRETLSNDRRVEEAKEKRVASATDRDTQSSEAASADPPNDKVVKAAIECGEKGDALSHSFSCALEGQPLSERIEDARLLAASCFQGKLWSITVRSKEKNRKQADSEPKRIKSLGETKYQASDEYNGNALFSIKDVCQTLKERLFEDDESHPHGAVIVTGATASSKSLITMGLINDYLARCVGEYAEGKQKRKPHLVTVEDPIEEWFREITPNYFKNPKLFRRWPIDYTPRQIGGDVKSLSKALRDALRQTPSVVLVSEIRDDKGWRELMDFAGTGHLVFATGHAGSLTEAMGKIIKALGAKTPADRAMIAERILGLIHVRREFIKSGKSGESPALMLSLWRRKGVGRQNFISDGLSALAPQAGKAEDMSSIGRLWFAKKMIKRRCTGREIRELPKSLQERILQRARKLDLEGQ